MRLPLENTSRCSGCGACSLKCPRGAIAMKPDSEGFFRPQVDAEQCVDCGLCAAVCPINDPPRLTEAPQAFAAYHKDRELRRTSSSGGVFTALARCVLSGGGAVVGAALDADGVVRHRVVEADTDLAALRGSKYVQSEAWHVYAKVRALLTEGRKVLFSGTPCQIAGLATWLGKPYEGLYLVDLICHGAPSPRAWRAYTAQREQKAGSPIVSAEFRSKVDGWQRYQLRLQFANGTCHSQSRQKDPYMRAFLKNAALRPSCHACASKGKNRASDLTLADFWGVERLHPQIDAFDGVSLVLANTEKGKALLSACSPQLQLQPTEMKQALAENGSYAHSSPMHPKRAQFFAALDTVPFDTIADRCCRDRLSEKLRRAVGGVRRRVLRLVKR